MKYDAFIPRRRANVTAEDQRFGRQLAERRCRLNLSLRDVCEDIGISTSTLWYYEHAYARCGPVRRAQLDDYYSRIEQQRGTEGEQTETITLPELNEKAREIVRDAVDRLNELLEKGFDPK